jgi:hypothetical protein
MTLSGHLRPAEATIRCSCRQGFQQMQQVGRRPTIKLIHDRSSRRWRGYRGLLRLQGCMSRSASANPKGTQGLARPHVGSMSGLERIATPWPSPNLQSHQNKREGTSHRERCDWRYCMFRLEGRIYQDVVLLEFGDASIHKIELHSSRIENILFHSNQNVDYVIGSQNPIPGDRGGRILC